MYFPFSKLHGWGKRFAVRRRRFIQRFPYFSPLYHPKEKKLEERGIFLNKLETFCFRLAFSLFFG